MIQGRTQTCQGAPPPTSGPLGAGSPNNHKQKFCFRGKVIILSIIDIFNVQILGGPWTS